MSPQQRRPAEAGCGQNWPPHPVGGFSTLSCGHATCPPQQAGEKMPRGLQRRLSAKPEGR
jgi:hypothetical protein